MSIWYLLWNNHYFSWLIMWWLLSAYLSGDLSERDLGPGYQIKTITEWTRAFRVCSFYVYGGCEWVSSFLVAHHGGCRSLMERLWVVILGHSYMHRAGQFMEHSRRYTNLGLSDYTVTVLGSGGPRRNIRCEVDLSVLRRASSCT